MNKLMMAGSAVLLGVSMSGCALFGPSRCAELTDAENDDTATLIWYSNVKMFADASDPRLDEMSRVGVKKWDNWFDAQHDYTMLTVRELKTKIQTKMFDSMYTESAKILNSGADGKSLALRAEAFKGVLTLAASEEKHAYDAATNRYVGLVRNDIFPLNTAKDDDTRKKFFDDPKRANWTKRTDFVVNQLTTCVAKSDDDAAAEAGMQKLNLALGVKPWTKEEEKARSNAKARLLEAYAVLYPRFTKTSAFYAEKTAELGAVIAAKAIAKKDHKAEKEALKELTKRAAVEIPAALAADKAALALEEAKYSPEQKNALKKARMLQQLKEKASEAMDSGLSRL